MGIPYSKQINAAFDQVTPLVGAGFRVLETTKNIAVLLAFIEVFSIVLLSLILMALFALLVTMSPDLEEERRTLVTPILKGILSAIQQRVDYWNKNSLKISVGMAFLIIGATFLFSPFVLRKLNIKTKKSKRGNEAVTDKEGIEADEADDNAPNSEN